jgi:ABC-2 type transport system ATP-binding protein
MMNDDRGPVPPRGGTATPAIEVSGLRVVRGRNVVLDDFDLTVPAGQVVGLLGPSGSGKTTLMRAIVGAQRIAGGRVNVFGQEAGTAPLRRRVGYTTQSPSVYLDLTVAENLRYAAAILRVDDSRIGRVLEEVGLAGFEKRIVGTLSGGELSRVSLSVALLGSPDLLVLDEPTVGLDPVLRRDLWTLFARLRDEGASLLVSSHVMDEASRCDRLVLLRTGTVLADATLPELLERTGAADAEGAFLTLVDEANAAAAAEGGAAA